jgi:DNA-binding MarR family transcriptional regulator
VKHDRDDTGHWVAGLSGPTLSMRDLVGALDELQRRQARRMGLGVTDMQALRLLDVHGPMGPSELARRLDLRTASTTALLDRLESAAWLERTREGRDRRRVTVRILPAAAEVLFDTWAPVVRELDDVGSALSAEDQTVVCGFLELIVGVIARHHGDEFPPSG